MLVLTRRPGESTLIGNDVEVFVLEVHGNQVRLGIAAPKETLILRDELTQRSSSAPACCLPDVSPKPS